MHMDKYHYSVDICVQSKENLCTVLNHVRRCDWSLTLILAFGQKGTVGVINAEL